MGSARTTPADEGALIEAARAGDEDAYGLLVEGRRGELHAHCYRILGSLHDADDALQDTMLRAWRGLPRFDGRSSLRTWLHRIAVNASLDILAKRRPRALPVERGTAHDPREPLGEPVTESVWIEPYPDEDLPEPGDAPGPDARYERRESLELAFVAAMQRLPPNGRAALVLRDVLGFSAEEAAETVGTSVPSLNSALQRARRSIDERTPERSQQEVLRELGDARVRGIVRDYADAMQRGDVDTVVGMLTEDATWSMPPLPCWFAGRDTGVRGFLVNYGLTVRWRHLPAHANGQPAVGCYAWDEPSGRYLASVLDVLTLDGPRIAAVTGFGTDAVFGSLGRPDVPAAVSDLFGRFGLPGALDR